VDWDVIVTDRTTARGGRLSSHQRGLVRRYAARSRRSRLVRVVHHQRLPLPAAQGWQEGSQEPRSAW